MHYPYNILQNPSHIPYGRNAWTAIFAMYIYMCVCVCVCVCVRACVCGVVYLHVAKHDSYMNTHVHCGLNLKKKMMVL